MGIIQKQALRNVLINFSGAIFGSLTRLSMPLLISEAQIGILSLLDSISGSFLILFNLGYSQVLLKLFPKYRDADRGHYGFFAFGIFLSIIGILASWVIYYFFGDLFLNEDDESAHLFRSFAVLVFPLVFFRILFVNNDAYVRMLYNSIIGSFLDTFLTKIVLAVALASFWLSIINYDYLVYIFAFNLCLPGIAITIYAMLKTKKLVLPQPELISKENRNAIGAYVLFGVLMGASNSVVLYVDSLMVTKLISLKALGIYATFFMAARLIVIPQRAISRISGVVLAESWKENDMEEVLSVYKKTCLNQVLLGAFLFGIGWNLIGPALTLSAKLSAFETYKYVFFFLGLGLVVEMATGLNAGIISVTEKYKYNTYFNGLLAIFIIISNFIFIYFFGLIGAAVASLVSWLIINSLRWLFLYKVYNLQPFDNEFLKALTISVGFILICHFVDYKLDAVYKIIINGVLLTTIFWLIVIKLKISEDINKWIDKMTNKYFS